MHIYQNKLKLPNKLQCIKHENSVFANIMYYLKFATIKLENTLCSYIVMMPIKKLERWNKKKKKVSLHFLHCS